MASSPYALSPCTAADIPGMVTVWENAFANNYLTSYTFPATIERPEMRCWLTARFTTRLSLPEVRHFKITEVSTGIMAAWTCWAFPHVLSPEEKLRRERQKEENARAKQEGKAMPWPEGANAGVCEAKFGGLDKFRAKYVKPEDMYLVTILAVDPAFQRKGLGSMLLKHGLDLADAECRKVYIEGTPDGHPMYLKLGFKDIDKLSVDVSQYGGKEPAVNWIMIRDPNPTQPSP